MTKEATTRLVIYIVLACLAVIGGLKAWIFLPQQVATQAAQSVTKWQDNKDEHSEIKKDNKTAHVEMADDIETLDDEGHAIGMDVVELKTNVNHIKTEQENQEKRQVERHKEIIDKIKELHK